MYLNIEKIIETIDEYPLDVRLKIYKKINQLTCFQMENDVNKDHKQLKNIIEQINNLVFKELKEKYSF